MGFRDAVRSGFANYAIFRGRAARSEFWWFALLWFAADALGTLVDIRVPDHVGLLVVVLPLVLPFLAVMVRRLHDTGGSAWLLLWILMPLVGEIVVLVQCAAPGQRSENAYGEPHLAHNPG